MATEVVAERVTIQADGFPVAVFLRFRRQSRLLTKTGEQPIEVECEEVLSVDFFRMLEGPLEQLDRGQVEVGQPCPVRHVRSTEKSGGGEHETKREEKPGDDVAHGEGAFDGETRHAGRRTWNNHVPT